MSDYIEFWDYFLTKAQLVIPLYKGVSPKNKSYLHTKKGNFDKFCVAFNTKESISWVERCFQAMGPEGVRESNRKFDHFFRQKNSIEEQYGGSLEWMQLPEKKRSRILSERVYFNIEDKNSWDETIDKLLKKMTRFIPAIENAYPGLDDSIQVTDNVANSTIVRRNNYYPDKGDAEKAIGQIFPNNSVVAILDQIEKNFIEADKILAQNWRVRTEENIKREWFN